MSRLLSTLRCLLAPPTGLAAPAGLAGTPSDGQVALTWSAVPGASTYNLYRSTTSGGEVQVQTGLSGTSYTNTGLTNRTTYYFQLTAVIGGVEGPKSAEIAVFISNLHTTISGHWELSEASGQTRLDSTSNHNDLTDHNTVGQTAGVGGVGNAALFVAANSTYLTAADSASLSTGPSVSFALDCFFKLTSDTGANQTLISKDDSAAQREYRLWISNLNQQSGFVFDSNIDSGSADNNVTITTGVWHHLSLVYDKTAGKIYVRLDGADPQLAASYATGAFDSTALFTLGRLTETGNRHLDGAMQRAGMAKRAWDHQDVLDRFNRGNGNPWPFTARRWLKYNSNSNPSIITPSGGDIGVAEPHPWNSTRISNTYVMAHTRVIDGSTSYIVRRTSTDAITWSAATTIIGNNTGGESSTTVARPCILVDGSTTYLYYVNLTGGLAAVATSTDDVSFTRQATDIFPHGGLTSWSQFGNTCVIKDGSTYRAIVEWKDASNWHLAYYTSSSPTSGWTLQVARYTSLEYASGTASGPFLFKIGSTFYLYFHRGATSGAILPSRIFYATTSDLSVDSWTVGSGGAPVIAITESSTLTGNHPVDQVADFTPMVVTRSDGLNLIYGFYDVDQNSTGYNGAICLAIYPAPDFNTLVSDGG